MFGLALSADIAFAVFFAFIISIFIEPQLLQGNQQQINTASAGAITLIQLPEKEENQCLKPQTFN